MTQALILVNGFAASDDALAINNLVTLANDNGGGELTYLWSITAQPPGPADALTSTTTLATTLTPTKEGNYRIQLIVNQGLGDERVATAIVGVLQIRSQVSQPAAGETTELGAQGWAVRMNQTIRLVDQLNADPGSFICVTTTGEAVGTPVTISGAQIIMSGLPGETTIPTIAVVDAATAADVAGPVGVILGTVDGGAVGPGSLVYVRFNGLASVPVAGSPAAGTTLAAAGSPAATIVPVSSLGPSDPYRYVGVSCGADPLVGANTLIAWAGAGSQVAASARDVLWAWNGINTSQFVNNPLPGPSFTGGTMTNAELTAVAEPLSPSQFVLRLSADEGAGAAVWWITDEVDFASIKSIQARFGKPTPGPLATSTEEVAFGVVFAGDDGPVHLIAIRILYKDNGATADIYQQVIQFEESGPTNVVVTDDLVPGQGYVWRLNADFAVARSDASYNGPPGVPNGSIDPQLSAWSPGPTSGLLFPHSSMTVFNAAFQPPGLSWATSACNRIGVLLGGVWTNALSGAQTCDFFEIKFLR